jgi:hypothetical protein
MSIEDFTRTLGSNKDVDTSEIHRVIVVTIVCSNKLGDILKWYCVCGCINPAD